MVKVVAPALLLPEPGETLRLCMIMVHGHCLSCTSSNTDQMLLPMELKPTLLGIRIILTELVIGDGSLNLGISLRLMFCEYGGLYTFVVLILMLFC